MKDYSLVQVPTGRNSYSFHRLGSCIIGQPVAVKVAEREGYKPCKLCRPLTSEQLAKVRW